MAEQLPSVVEATDAWAICRSAPPLPFTETVLLDVDFSLRGRDLLASPIEV